MSGNDHLVDSLVADGVLHTPAIINAFRAIDRADFVSPETTEAAYMDVALPTLSGQTISQPYTVAVMLELLQPRPGNTVLDVGFGSGWQSALLAHIVRSSGHVVVLEIVLELCEWGRKNIEAYNYIGAGIVEVHCMSASKGYSKGAPFDRIIAAAAGIAIPMVWRDQLKINGRIVAPVGTDIVQLTKSSQSKWQEQRYPGFVFV
ncbi:MAG: protein-L-isoaspartate O-methyltransferase, partial [Candidatus Andersenbacteria bacterium]